MESELTNFTSNIVVRTGEPHAFDQAPYGTICKVVTYGDTFDLYIQLSHTESSPNWSMFGSFDIGTSDNDLINRRNKILQPSS